MTTTIPKSLHFICWQGVDPLPAHLGAAVESWKHVHPGWSVDLWDGAKVKGLVATLPGYSPADLQTFLDRDPDDAGRAKFASLIILQMLGGVFCDLDLLCLRSIEPLVAERSFYACSRRMGEISFGSGLLASARGHPLVTAMMEALIYKRIRPPQQATGEPKVLSMTRACRVVGPLIGDISGENRADEGVDMDAAAICLVSWPGELGLRDAEVLRQRYPRSHAVRRCAVGGPDPQPVTCTPWSPAERPRAPIRLTHSHVINLARRPDRWQRLGHHLHEELGWTLPIHRRDAVDTSSWHPNGGHDATDDIRDYVAPGQVDFIARDYRTEHAHLSRGAVGCALSHLELWKRLAVSPHEDHMLVFEDDALWARPHKMSAEDVSASINAMRPDWDIVLLGAWPKEILEDHGWWLRLGFFHTTHAYVIHRSALPKLLETFLPMREQLDSYLSRRILEADLKVYTYTQRLFGQTWADTDVQTTMIGSPLRDY